MAIMVSSGASRDVTIGVIAVAVLRFNASSSLTSGVSSNSPTSLYCISSNLPERAAGEQVNLIVY